MSSRIEACLHVSAIAVSTAAAATNWWPLLSLPCLGAGSLFAHLPKAMSQATSEAAVVEEEEQYREEDTDGTIFALILDGGGTKICWSVSWVCAIVSETVKHKNVFKCRWGRWRPYQTPGQGCGQVRKT